MNFIFPALLKSKRVFPQHSIEKMSELIWKIIKGAGIHLQNLSAKVKN
jgi:hypothetical protein